MRVRPAMSMGFKPDRYNVKWSGNTPLISVEHSTAFDVSHAKRDVFLGNYSRARAFDLTLRAGAFDLTLRAGAFDFVLMSCPTNDMRRSLNYHFSMP
jgi:hypothetical protein